MVRSWISFHELFDDPNEPDDVGIDLTNPEFGDNMVTFTIVHKGYDTLECITCGETFKIRHDYVGIVTCPYCGALVRDV